MDTDVSPTIDIEDPFASALSGNICRIVSHNGGEITDIVFKADVERENDQTTISHIHTGPQAMTLMQATEENIDWNNYTVNRLRVWIDSSQTESTEQETGDTEENVMEFDPAGVLSSSDTDDEADSEDDSEDTDEPDTTEVSVETIDPYESYMDAFGDVPSTQPGTHVHTFISALASYLIDNGGVSGTINDVYDSVETDLTLQQFQNAAVGSDKTKYLSMDISDESGNENKYSLTLLGVSYLEDVGSVAEIGLDVDKLNEIQITIPDILADYSTVSDSANNGSSSGYSVSGRTCDSYGSEEPNTDSPRPLKQANTHKHEILRALKRYHEDNDDSTDSMSWVSIPNLWKNGYIDKDVIPETDSASSAASELFLEYGLCKRRRSNREHGGGVLMQYQINTVGFKDLKRLNGGDN